MNLRTMIFLILLQGLFFISTTAERAPAQLKMTLSYNLKKSEHSNAILTLESTVGQSDCVTNIAENTELKRKSLHGNVFETSIFIDTDNIKKTFKYIGKLVITNRLEEDLTLSFSAKFTFDRKLLRLNMGKMILSKTFYDSKYLHELDVIITAQCKDNYYPNYVCDTFCVKTKNAKHCDENGNKICERGFYYNNETDQCENDWCTSAHICKNGGKCINSAYRSKCQCPISYQGTYCQEFREVCKSHVCPNQTLCIVENEGIKCQPIQSLQKITKKTEALVNISLTTMGVIALAIIVLAVGFCVTFWACKQPKRTEYRSSEESIDYKTSYINYVDTKSNPQPVPMDHSYCPCRCTDKQQDWTHGRIDNYYSLRIPHDRVACRSVRPNSDLLLSRSNGRVSRTSSIHTTLSNSGLDSDSLQMPMPPPIECNETFII